MDVTNVVIPETGSRYSVAVNRYDDGVIIVTIDRYYKEGQHEYMENIFRITERD